MDTLSLNFITKNSKLELQKRFLTSANKSWILHPIKRVSVETISSMNYEKHHSRLFCMRILFPSAHYKQRWLRIKIVLVRPKSECVNWILRSTSFHPPSCPLDWQKSLVWIRYRYSYWHKVTKRILELEINLFGQVQGDITIRSQIHDAKLTTKHEVRVHWFFLTFLCFEGREVRFSRGRPLELFLHDRTTN